MLLISEVIQYRLIQLNKNVDFFQLKNIISELSVEQLIGRRPLQLK